MSSLAQLHDPAEHSAAPFLQRIPLSLRMTVYTLFFLGTVLGALPALFFQLDVRVPSLHIEIGSWRVAGYIIFGVSLLAYLVASIVLTTKGKGPFVEFDPPKLLVVDGPYRFVRNPVVCALLGTMSGEALMFSSTGILTLFAVFAALAHIQVVRFEEPLLRQRYGAPYEDFCRDVPRWVPRLSPYRPDSNSRPNANPEDSVGKS